MADKKVEVFGTDSDKKAFEKLTFLLLGLVLLGAIATALLNYLESFSLDTTIISRIVDYFLARIWPIWKLVAGILSILLLAGILNNAWRLRAINIAEQPIYRPNLPGSASDESEVEGAKNKRWEKVLEYANSDNPSDQRQAIIEADVMLEELLRTLGYEGASVGEILKSVDKNEFSTIDVAWEAHKARNTVAHSGGDFQLNGRETRRIIALFEQVFREFGLI